MDPAPEGDAASAARRPAKTARLEYITQATREHGFMHVDDLAEQLGVSRMTVHRDLDELQRLGTLRKVRGGASAQRSTQFESDLAFRSAHAATEKLAIARAAIEFASEGDVVLIDDSTTALALVPLLEDRGSMTVITNFLPALNELAGMHDITTIGLGGQYVSGYAAFLGMVCETAIKGLYADVLFTSTSSILDGTLYHQDQRVVAAKRAMISVSQRRVLLLDHTKFGQGALHQLCEVDEFTDVVVDAGVEPAHVRALEERGVTVHVAASS